MSTTVIHIKDAPPNFKHNPDYVYIGRGGDWGNPYRIQDEPATLNALEKRQSVINKFMAYLKYNDDLIARLPELQDKILVCYCKPHACHGDILAQWENCLHTFSGTNVIARRTLEMLYSTSEQRIDRLWDELKAS